MTTIYNIYNSTFTDNQAANDGGAIHNDGGYLTVTGSEFTGNLSGRYGGAIDSDDNSIAVVENSSFDNNAAASRGGAINNDGNMTIAENTVITGNTVGNWGGAIHTDDYLWIEDSVISLNEAIEGGGIYNRGEDLQIVDSILSENSAEEAGGALYTRDGTTIISGTQIDANTAEEDGGGIYAYSNHTLTVSDTVFSNNAADELGGGIFARSVVGITNSAFVENTAVNNGGAFYNNSSGVPTVNDTCIVDNSDTAVYASSGTRDFTENWWGDASGPSGSGSGTGDSVNGNIDYANFLTDDSVCTGLGNPLDDATLVLSPLSAGPNLTDTDQTMTATLLDAEDNPLEGYDITFTITGANAQTDDVTTDSNGVATFIYTGVNAGTDSIQADIENGWIELESDEATITWDAIAGATLTIDPTFAGPNPISSLDEEEELVNSEQTFTVTLLDAEGDPIEGATVQFYVSGPNEPEEPEEPEDILTDSEGKAEFILVGDNTGTDTVTASVTSDIVYLEEEATVIWFAPVEDISTSTVWARFYPHISRDLVSYPADIDYPRFSATPEQEPLFEQIFPTINFNPPNPGFGQPTIIPNKPSNINQYTVGFINVTTDEYGSYTGNIIAQGNGYQAGVDSLFSFDAVFTGEFTIAEAGDYSLHFYSDDGFIIGIDNGASYVSGVFGPEGAVPSVTPFEGFPVVGALNDHNPPSGHTVVVNFPAPGRYQFEIDYFQTYTCCRVLTLTVERNGVKKGIPPTGALTLIFDDGTESPSDTGETVEFEVTAIDGAGDPMQSLDVVLTVEGANAQELVATTDTYGVATFSYTGQNVGTDTIQAIAWAQGDISAYSAELIMEWESDAPPDGTVFAIPGWIKSPENQSVVRGQVPITLINGISLADGTLQIWPVNDTNQVTTLASGLTTTSGGQLAVLDTTLFANGSYVIYLNATSTGTPALETDSAIMITIEGEYKPGRVRFSVTDLTIPATGLPITIGRTYDSLDRNTKGDFGYGWTLDIANPKVDINAAGDVSLTMPDGRRSTFYFTPQAPSPLLGFLLQPTYTPQAGVYGSLTSNGCDLLTVSGGSYFCFPGGKYEATEFTYIDPYGREFVMSDDGTLQSITDLNGNTLTFSSTGITSSAGGLNVQFVRDGQDRITQIIDPEGNIYGYDYDLAGDLVEVDLPDVTGNVDYFYVADHLFERANDPRGNDAAVTTYYTDGRLESVTDGEGYTTEYTYNLTSRITTLTEYDGVGGTGNSYTTELTYDEWGYIILAENDLGEQTKRQYDENHNLEEEIVDFGGLNITTTYDYDENGHQTKITNAEADSVDTTYNQFGGPTELATPLNTVTIQYDPVTFMPTSGSDPMGSLGSQEFASNGNVELISYSDPNGPGTIDRSFQYDTYGNLEVVIDENGGETRFTYNTLGQRIKTRTPLGHETHYEYDGLGRLTKEIDPLGNETEYVYDGNGNQIATIDALGNQTDYIYDANNRVIEVRYPAPNPSDPRPISYTTYDFRGNALTETDPEGTVAHYQYDDAGRPTFVTQAYGTGNAITTRYQYDGAGRTTDVTYAYGTALASTTHYVLDGVGRSESVTEAYGTANARTTSYEYDGGGQVLKATDQNGMEVHYEYDTRGRQTKIITNYENGMPDPAKPDEDIIVSMTYDNLGRMTSQTDANLLTTDYEYDNMGRLTKVIYPPVNSIRFETEYVYDAAGQLEEVIDANGNRTRFEYDELGRQYRKYWTWPNNTVYEQFTYDDVGNLTAHRLTDGSVNTFDYDDLHRIDTESYFDGQTYTYTYTQVGNIQSVTIAGDTTTYSYDELHRPSVIAHQDGRRVEYDYDDAGNRSLVVIRLSGGGAEESRAEYTYNNLHQLIKVYDPATGNTGYDYDSIGLVDNISLPNGVTVDYAYDNAYRLTQIHHYKAPQELGLYTYALDPTGNRVGLTETDAVSNSTTYSWEYDNLYRLKQETRTPSGSSAVVTNYDYDRTGNRLYEDVVGGQLTDYTYNALDQMTSISIDSGTALVYGYDGRGNMTSKPDGTAYTYDAMDRLVEVDLPDTTHIDYDYDWDGRRIQKDVDSGTEVINYLWDEFSPFGDVLLETDDTSTVLGNYTLANGQLISQTRTGIDRFYLADGQHSIRALVDDAGTVNVTDNYTYKAFGDLLTSNETTENAYRYTGQQYDELTGLYSLRARYYNPTDGRFLSRDTYPFDFKNPSELNRYAYVANNPINMFDPTGLAGLADFGKIVSKIGVASIKAFTYAGKLIATLNTTPLLGGAFQGLEGYVLGLAIYNGLNCECFNVDELMKGFEVQEAFEAILAGIILDAANRAVQMVAFKFANGNGNIDKSLFHAARFGEFVHLWAFGAIIAAWFHYQANATDEEKNQDPSDDSFGPTAKKSFWRGIKLGVVNMAAAQRYDHQGTVLPFGVLATIAANTYFTFRDKAQ